MDMPIQALSLDTICSIPWTSKKYKISTSKGEMFLNLFEDIQEKIKDHIMITTSKKDLFLKSWYRGGACILVHNSWTLGLSKVVVLHCLLAPKIVEWTSKCYNKNTTKVKVGKGHLIFKLDMNTVKKVFILRLEVDVLLKLKNLALEYASNKIGFRS